jgi:hypothetical protein
MSSKYIRVTTLSVNLNVIMWAIAIIAAIIITAKGSSPTGLFPILFGGVAVSIYVVTSKQSEDGGTDT